MDDTLLSAAVWRASDEWQIDDDPVDLHLRVREKFSNILLASAVGLVLFAALSHTVFGAIAGPVAMGLLAVAAVVLAVWIKANVGRVKSVAGVRRRVAAVVVAHRGISAVIATEGRYLRVRPIAWPMWQVIARTGEITVVGPDAKGNAVVFVDSQPAPLTAKIVAAPERVEADPVARVSWHGAEDEIPMAYARQQVRRLWLQPGALLVAVAGFAIDAVLDGAAWAGNGSVAALFALCLAGFPFAAAAMLRLPRLLAAGQWKQYQAVLLSWRSDGQQWGAADLSVQLSRTDGELRRMVVKAAPVEVVAHVNATGTLWVIDSAEGRLTAAGVPGYPVAALAKFV